jgi:hypothetical protein
MWRILAGLLALILVINGLAMLFASFWWYGAVPGVTATGPYNAHFVRDIGAAYLVAAGGLAWFASRPVQGWPALAAGAAFLVAHAGIHVFDAACSPAPLAMVVQDFVGVYLLALLPALIAVLRKPRSL